MEEPEKKWAIPRGHAATVAKNKYREKKYDRAELSLPRGMKATIKEAAKEQGLTFNGYVVEAVKEKYMNDTGKELYWKENEEDQKEVAREMATAAGMEVIEDE